MTYGAFLGLLLIFPLLTSQFTPLNLSRNRLWKFGNEGHLVTIKKKNKKKNSLQLSFHSKTFVLKESLPSDMSLESIHDSWFSPNGNNKNSWPGIQALSRSISVPPIESCLCQFLGRPHSVLKGRPSEETGRNG